MKTLFWDIENLQHPRFIFDSGALSKFNPRPAGMCADKAYILMFGYKWEHERDVFCTLPTKKQFEKNPFTDEYILQDIEDVLNSAERIVTWYGKGHDKPFTAARLAQQGLYLDNSIQHIDLRAIAKSNLALSSYRMDNVAKFFGLEQKTKISPEVWAKTWGGNYDAMREMAAYCKQDVVVLAQLYEHLKQYIPQTPHMAYLKNKNKLGCPICGSDSSVSKGLRYTKFYTYQSRKCNSCGARFKGEKVE